MKDSWLSEQRFQGIHLQNADTEFFEFGCAEAFQPLLGPVGQHAKPLLDQAPEEL